MDEETASLIDALRTPGAAILLKLLEGDATEDELREVAPDHSQSAVNRKLHRLAKRRLIQREAGSKQQKHLRWSLVSPEHVEQLIRVAVQLARIAVDSRSEALAETEARLRSRTANSRLREAG